MYGFIMACAYALRFLIQVNSAMLKARIWLPEKSSTHTHEPGFRKVNLSIPPAKLRMLFLADL